MGTTYVTFAFIPNSIFLLIFLLLFVEVEILSNETKPCCQLGFQPWHTIHYLVSPTLSDQFDVLFNSHTAKVETPAISTLYLYQSKVIEAFFPSFSSIKLFGFS